MEALVWTTQPGYRDLIRRRRYDSACAALADLFAGTVAWLARFSLTLLLFY